MTPANRITRYLRDPDYIAPPRWSPPEPPDPERLSRVFWVAVGFAMGLVVAWATGGGR